MAPGGLSGGDGPGRADPYVVLAVGNDLLGDDAVGLLAGAALEADGHPVRTAVRSGLALLDAVVGARRVLLVDSQATGRPPGTVSEFILAAEGVRTPSAHYIGYGEALTIGEAVGLALPEEIRVLAVERSPVVTFGDDLSKPVRAALPGVLDRARAIVEAWAAG